MPYEFLEHTADVRMRVTGRSLQDLFEAALAGMRELLDPRCPDPEMRTMRTIILESGDETALLIDFLNRVLLYAQTHREAYGRASFQRLTRNQLVADVEGCPVQSFGEDIKAVTYHEANVRRSIDGGWETMVVFDI